MQKDIKCIHEDSHVLYELTPAFPDIAHVNRVYLVFARDLNKVDVIDLMNKLLNVFLNV